MKKFIIAFSAIILPVILPAQTRKFFQYRIVLHAGSVPENTKAYLIYQTNGAKIFDSALVKRKTISFSGRATSLLPATIVLDNQAIGLQNLMKKREGIDYLKVYLCSGLSEADVPKGLASARFISPGINADYAVLKQDLKEVDERWAQVSRAMITATRAGEISRLRRENDSLRMTRIPLLEQFIRQHPKSAIALVAWEEWKGITLRADENATREVRQLFETLSPEIRNSDEASSARIFFANQTALKPGQPAPDFQQNDVNGRPVRLSDFRGKYLLLDFWASWCGPCRQASPALVRLYDEFSSKNFTILGISLDDQQGRKDWLKAIKTDGLKWQQVSDLRHWDNAIVKQYSVSAVPFSILVDPDGRIVMLGGSAEDVRRKLLSLNLK